MAELRNLYYRVLTKLRLMLGSRDDAGTRSTSRWLRVLGRRNLSWLASLHGTDKRAHAHNYVSLYEQHLGHLRRRPIALLEIGVLGGASLRMWRDFFFKSTLTGLDINAVYVTLPATTLVQGDQSDPDVLKQVREGGPFDVIIDDGSHVGAHIEASFHALFPELRGGGFYVIEDMQTAYRSDYGGGPPGSPGTSVALVKDLIDAVNRRWISDAQEPVPEVRSVHVYEKIVFIEKA